jgi:hypothetical protein
MNMNLTDVLYYFLEWCLFFLNTNMIDAFLKNFVKGEIVVLVWHEFPMLNNVMEWGTHEEMTLNLKDSHINENSAIVYKLC